jgi:mRNA interferase RelE/StbE
MYRIVVHHKVAKQLKTVSKSHLRRLSELLELLKTNPIPWRDCDLKRIVGAENTYRVRIGVYRVVYFIEKEKETIHILKFERREKVYK